MVKLKAQHRAANCGEIFYVLHNSTSCLGKLEILSTETPKQTHLLSFGE